VVPVSIQKILVKLQVGTHVRTISKPVPGMWNFRPFRPEPFAGFVCCSFSAYFLEHPHRTNKLHPHTICQFFPLVFPARVVTLKQAFQTGLEVLAQGDYMGSGDGAQRRDSEACEGRKLADIDPAGFWDW
jgi:hypothetical protein